MIGLCKVRLDLSNKMSLKISSLCQVEFKISRVLKIRVSDSFELGFCRVRDSHPKKRVSKFKIN